MSYDEAMSHAFAAAKQLADGATGLMSRRDGKMLVYGTPAQVAALVAKPVDNSTETVLHYGD